MARVKVKVAGAADEVVNQSVGSVGAVANAKGPLVDGDITFANSAYFPLDGDVLNDASLGGDLTNNGSVTFTGDGFFSRSNIASFNGTNDLSSSDAFFNGATMTTGGWFKLNPNDGTTDIIMSNEASGSDRRFKVEYRSDGDLIFAATNAASPSSYPSTISVPYYTPTEWHHYVVQYDDVDNVMRLYIDGKLIGEEALSDLRAVTAPTFRVMSLSGYSFAHGKVQDFFYTTDVLTDVQINAIYSKRFSNHQQLAGGHVLTDDSFPVTDLTDKVSYWNLDTLNDASGNANHWVDGGSVEFTGSGLFGAANSIKFDGSTDYLTPTDATFFDLGESASFTIGAWIASDDWSVQGTLWTQGDGDGTSNHTYRSYVDGLGYINSEISDGAARPDNLTNIAHLVNGAWHHYVLVIENNTQKAYLDGVLTASTNLQLQASPASSTLHVGSFAGGTNKFSGRMSEMFAANIALNAEDIRKLYSSSIPIPGDAIAPEDQKWEGHAVREDGHVTGELATGWLVDKRSDKIYVDLGGASAETAILKLKRDS